MFWILIPLLFKSLFVLAQPTYNTGAFWRAIDTANPTCTITSALSGWRSFSAETINFNCSDDYRVAKAECRLNGGAWANCTTLTSYTSPTLANDTTYTFEVRATDYFGKQSSVGAAQTRTWSVDLATPSVSITSWTGTNTGSSRIYFSGTDNESGVAGYQCSIDTGTASWVACSGSYLEATGSAGVTYYFRVIVTDNVGRVSGQVTTSWRNGNWGGWSGCSVSCGGGSMTRACNNPSPSGSPPGMGCSGISSQACNTHSCCTAANNTSNMCPGNYYTLQAYNNSNPSCPTPYTQPPDGTGAAKVDSDPAVPAGGVVSCASGSISRSNLQSSEVCAKECTTWYTATCRCN
ncbi:hypothetical protein [Bdellovibrio sp. HCB288]|uniref:thrombospondin type-1 domain-containing protein n=1 Tax=Bdellovibrio sp. HCB288 TaxID=3394355 RepID=UPI0039B45849